jgi:hypothetical protein
LVQIFSSTPCSQTPSAYVPPLNWAHPKHKFEASRLVISEFRRSDLSTRDFIAVVIMTEFPGWISGCLRAQGFRGSSVGDLVYFLLLPHLLLSFLCLFLYSIPLSFFDPPTHSLRLVVYSFRHFISRFHPPFQRMSPFQRKRK